MTEKGPLSLKKALEFMRGGNGRQRACLLKSAGIFYVVPGGYVEPDTAKAIKKRPDVIGGEEGVWPHHDWKKGFVLPRAPPWPPHPVAGPHEAPSGGVKGGTSLTLENTARVS